jgi:hypothetical protein
MSNPILRPRLPIQGGTLHINILIPNIEIHIPNNSLPPRNLTLDTHAPEERRRDKIHILPRIRENSHHSQGGEGTHGAGIVVSRETIGFCEEFGGDVEVRAGGGETWSSCVVVLVDGEEGLFVANVGYIGRVVVVEAFDEGVWATEGRY